MSISRGMRINWDLFGIVASIACAVHCAVLPVMMSSLPLFGINIIHNSFFEWGMIAFAFAVGAYSLVHGYLKHYKNTLPILLFSVGFIFLVLKQFFSGEDVVFLVIGVILIVTAHFLNFKFCRQGKVCDSHHLH